MKIRFSALAVLLFLTASTADAQVFGRRIVVGTPMVVSDPFPGYAVVPAAPYADVPPPGYIAPYSYYAAPYPYPARFYVGYGRNFPFYGTPYGHPSDRWSWSSLSGYPNPALACYYYPPVR